MGRHNLLKFSPGQQRLLRWVAGALSLCLVAGSSLCPASGPLTLPEPPGRSSGQQPAARRPRLTLSFEPIADKPAQETTPQEAKPQEKSAASATAPATPPAVPPGCATYPINLETALGLAGAENPTIALAQEAIRASRAEQLQADALLLPTLHAGTSIDVHRGNLQTSQGQILNVDRQSLYVGAGASAVGAGTVTVPGVQLTAQVADAIFEPRAAREQVTASSFEALATRNRVLLDVTTTYFALLGAEARLAALRQSQSDLGEVVRLSVNFAAAGERRKGDADRAESEASLLQATVQATEGEVAVTAADLARLLNLDPSVRLTGPGGAIPVVRLVDPHLGLEALIQMALRRRPEVAARTAAMAVVAAHLRQAQVRPFVPLLSLGFSAGDFGGGSNQADTRFGHFDGRTDFDVLAVWSFENFGFGDVAGQRRLQAAVAQAGAERARAIDRIRREVADAYARSAANIQQLEVARRRFETAQEGYRLDLLRARNLQGWPIEVLNSYRLLSAARQDFVRALVGFDQAQFELFVALGQPPTAIPAPGQPCP